MAVRSFEHLSGPRAAQAQRLRLATQTAILRDQALARRRRSHRLWITALLISAGAVAAVFQSCTGSRSAAKTAKDAGAVVASSDGKSKLPRRGKPAEVTDDGPPGKSAFDHAATDLQSLFDEMNSSAADGSSTPAVQSEAPPQQQTEHAAPSAAGRDREPPRDVIQPAPAPVAPADEHHAPPPAPATATVGPPEPPQVPAARAAPPVASPTAPQSLAFGAVALCQRVESFGRYTPLTSNGSGLYRFLAGRPAAAVVYCELDHFSQSPSIDATGESVFDAEFQTRIELFHDDGSRQWRASEATIRDQSRTRRRDFYLVQRIDLPANLTVGKYNLKIAVRDQFARDSDGQTAAAECEIVVPIEIVADAGLLNAPGATPRLVRGAPFAGPEGVQR